MYLLFPNSIMLFFGDHAEVFQVFPDGIDRSVTVQSVFAYQPIVDDEQRTLLETAPDFFYEIVAGQDYHMAAGVQRLLASGANDSFLLGRCEATTQAMHRDWEDLVGS